MFVLLFHLNEKVFTSKLMIANSSMTEVNNWEVESLIPGFTLPSST